MLANTLYLWWLAQVLAIAILVYLFLRWRPGFLAGRTIKQTLGQALAARENQIQAQLEAAQASREEAARIQETSARDIAQARVEADEIVTRAAQTSQAIQHEIEERARAEYERIIGQARDEIAYERERAEMALQRRAADIVVDAASQVVERYLDPRTDQKLIDQSLTVVSDLKGIE